MDAIVLDRQERVGMARMVRYRTGEAWQEGTAQDRSGLDGKGKEWRGLAGLKGPGNKWPGMDGSGRASTGLAGKDW